MDGFHSEASKCPYRVAPAVTSSLAALATFKRSASTVATETTPVARQAAEPVAVAFGDVHKRGPPSA